VLSAQQMATYWVKEESLFLPQGSTDTEAGGELNWF
jgi:hypothetical protein